MQDRIKRLEELFLKELSLILPRIKDQRLSSLLTVTGVRIARDLESAVIFYSVLGTELDKSNTAAALDRSRNFVWHRLSERMRIKRMPRLSFQYDDTPQKAAHIESIFEKIHSENPETAADSDETGK